MRLCYYLSAIVDRKQTKLSAFSRLGNPLIWFPTSKPSTGRFFLPFLIPCADKEFRSLRTATKGVALWTHRLLKKAGENFSFALGGFAFTWLCYYLSAIVDRKLTHSTVCFLMICLLVYHQKGYKVLWCYLSFKKGNKTNKSHRRPYGGAAAGEYKIGAAYFKSDFIARYFAAEPLLHGKT